MLIALSPFAAQLVRLVVLAAALLLETLGLLGTDVVSVPLPVELSVALVAVDDESDETAVSLVVELSGAASVSPQTSSSVSVQVESAVTAVTLSVVASSVDAVAADTRSNTPPMDVLAPSTELAAAAASRSFFRGLTVFFGLAARVLAGRAPAVGVLGA